MSSTGGSVNELEVAPAIGLAVLERVRCINPARKILR